MFATSIFVGCQEINFRIETSTALPSHQGEGISGVWVVTSQKVRFPILSMLPKTQCFRTTFSIYTRRHEILLVSERSNR